MAGAKDSTFMTSGPKESETKEKKAVIETATIKRKRKQSVGEESLHHAPHLGDASRDGMFFGREETPLTKAAQQKKTKGEKKVIKTAPTKRRKRENSISQYFASGSGISSSGNLFVETKRPLLPKPEDRKETEEEKAKRLALPKSTDNATGRTGSIPFSFLAYQDANGHLYHPDIGRDYTMQFEGEQCYDTSNSQPYNDDDDTEDRDGDGGHGISGNRSPPRKSSGNKSTKSRSKGSPGKGADSAKSGSYAGPNLDDPVTLDKQWYGRLTKARLAVSHVAHAAPKGFDHTINRPLEKKKSSSSAAAEAKKIREEAKLAQLKDTANSLAGPVFGAGGWDSDDEVVKEAERRHEYMEETMKTLMTKGKAKPEPFESRATNLEKYKKDHKAAELYNNMMKKAKGKTATCTTGVSTAEAASNDVMDLDRKPAGEDAIVNSSARKKVATAGQKRGGKKSARSKPVDGHDMGSK